MFGVAILAGVHVMRRMRRVTSPCVRVRGSAGVAVMTAMAPPPVTAVSMTRVSMTVGRVPSRGTMRQAEERHEQQSGRSKCQTEGVDIHRFFYSTGWRPSRKDTRAA